jgi:dynein heavy chain
VELPKVDYDNLRNALVDNCLKLGLQPLESLLIKAIQLYEMIVVRHGLMLVGQSYGMKTVAYRILAAALSGEGASWRMHATIALQKQTDIGAHCFTAGP